MVSVGDFYGDMLNNKRGCISYVCLGQRCKSNPVAIFNDGPASAIQVDDTILAFVHSKLPSGHHDNTTFYACHVRGAIDRAAD